VKQILVVDDNRDDVDIVRRALAVCGIATTVHVAENAVQAFDYLRQGPPRNDRPLPDLVILDIGMPIIDGIQALKVFKGDPRWKSIPVVMFVSAGRKDLMDECMALGAAAFHVKPATWAGYVDLFTALKVDIERGFQPCGDRIR
jgi:CheY-like chemotaxis protein